MKTYALGFGLWVACSQGQLGSVGDAAGDGSEVRYGNDGAEAAIDSSADSSEVRYGNDGGQCCPISASNDDACDGLWLGGTVGSLPDGLGGVPGCTMEVDGTPPSYMLTTDSNGCPMWANNPSYTGTTSCLSSWVPDTRPLTDSMNVAEVDAVSDLATDSDSIDADSSDRALDGDSN
jgi:hypothetical protein